MPDEQDSPDLQLAAPKTPRVALIASPRTLSDYPLYVKYLLVGLADESVPAILICPPDCDIDWIVPPTVQVARHPAIDVPLMHRYNLHILLDRLRTFQPDLLHCLCETRAGLARWTAKHLNLPYLVNVNSMSVGWQALTFSQKRCAGIVAPAKTIADHFAAAHPRLAQRLEQINIGTFVDAATNCFARPDRPPGIVVAHPMNAAADFEPLLLALHRLKIDGYQFIVAFIGGGPEERQVWKRLRSLDLLQIAALVPRLSGPHSAATAGDVFIAPKPHYSFDALLLSAMSVGSAVAACKGGVDDLIIEDKTAVVFDHNDHLGIYNSLRRLFDRREFAREIATGAQQYLRQNHQVSDMVASTLALYRRAAQSLRHQTESSAA